MFFLVISLISENADVLHFNESESIRIVSNKDFSTLISCMI